MAMVTATLYNELIDPFVLTSRVVSRWGLAVI